MGIKVKVAWEDDVGFWKASCEGSQSLYLTISRLNARDEEIQKEVRGRLNTDDVHIEIERPE